MNTIIKDGLQIKCPNCGNKFSPEAALEHDVKMQLEKEFEKKAEELTRTIEQRTIRMEEEKYAKRIKFIEADRLEKAQRLVQLEEKSLAFEEREQQLKERENQTELEFRKRLLGREKTLREEADKMAGEKAQIEIKEQQHHLEREKENMRTLLRKRVQEETEKAREEERMKAADLQKKLDDQTKLVNEMKRKSEQGSMQAQGEVQELAIEDFLKNSFLRDLIEEVAKGKRGADCVHHVRDGYGNACGRILYESKRTRNFSYDWTSKLKDNMRLTQADIGVLVTEVLPAELTRFGLFDGVYVCTYSEFKSLAVLFRDSLVRLGEVRTSQENKGEKMQLLYSYLTGTEFRQKMEAVVEAFQQMQDDLIKEKAQMIAQWSKREKQIYKVMENTISLYGDVRGIAGSAVKEIKALEIGEGRRLMA